jgi:hypothetical protein
VQIKRDALTWSWEYRDHLRVLLLGTLLSREETADWVWIDDAARELAEMRSEVSNYPHVAPFLSLVDDALQLSHGDRQVLMEQLVESIARDPESISPQLRAEIDRRLSSMRLR